MTPINWLKIRQNLMGERYGSIIPPEIKLPVLPKVLTEFLQRSKDDKCSFQELGSVIETDAGLTCELLRSLNSSKYGIKHKVHSVYQALSLLGLRNTKLLLITESLKHSMSQRESRLINLQTFWNTNLERAILARSVASQMGVDAEQAFAVAMIQDFMLPALSNEHTDLYADFMSRTKTNSTELIVAEHELFGWDHAEVGARLLLEWGFPDEMVVCVLLHHAAFNLLNHPQLGKTAAAAVAIAGQLPDVLRQVPNGLENLTSLEAHWPEFNLSETAATVEVEFDAASGTKQGFHTTLSQRLQKQNDHAGECISVIA